MPRHHDDGATVSAERAVGFSTVVLKAHEGSTVERAFLAGDGVFGGIVMNSTVGGANPDAVEVAAQMGARVVWMPTLSSRTHQAAAAAPELSLHCEFSWRAVDVIDDDGALRPEWYDVLDSVAAHDIVLASGHLSAQETVVLFTEARRRGVQRLMVNHPMMAFLNLDADSLRQLQKMEARLELGILPDLVGDADHGCLRLLDCYASELLVFGGDLGHAEYPTPADGVAPWLRGLEERAGKRAAAAIMTHQSRMLLIP